MTTFVLVHGAWHGGWCWSRVRRTLAAQGHEVFAPSLTGLGDRRHLLTPDVNLETHIEDIVGLITFEDLSDVVLCGHSYGGAVISGVADRIGERLKALVYLDALVIADRESVHNAMPSEYPEVQGQLAKEHGDGFKIPPAPASLFNVNEQDRAWVDALCTPHPLASFQQTLRLTGAEPVADISYIYATGWGPSPLLEAHHDRAKARGWPVVDFACGHDVMVDMPEELAAELSAIGARA